jgi:hypothetical protein
MATETNAAINPYSMAVAPDSSFMKRLIVSIVSHPPLFWARFYTEKRSPRWESATCHSIVEPEYRQFTRIMHQA